MRSGFFGLKRAKKSIGGTEDTPVGGIQAKCPSCGFDNPDDAISCQKCVGPLTFSDDTSLVERPVTRRISVAKMIVAVAVIVIVVVAALIIVSSLTNRKVELRADLSFSTSNATGLGLPTMGVIAVHGQIYNDGGKTGNGTVTLHVYDGFEWHNYSVTTGPVPGHRSVDFLWAEMFDPMIESEVTVEYEVMAN